MLQKLVTISGDLVAPSAEQKSRLSRDWVMCGVPGVDRRRNSFSQQQHLCAAVKSRPQDVNQSALSATSLPHKVR